MTHAECVEIHRDLRCGVEVEGLVELYPVRRQAGS